MIDNDKIKVVLNTDYKDYLKDIEYDTLIYTGPIDYFYNYKYWGIIIQMSELCI